MHIVSAFMTALVGLFVITITFSYYLRRELDILGLLGERTVGSLRQAERLVDPLPRCIFVLDPPLDVMLVYRYLSLLPQLSHPDYLRHLQQQVVPRLRLALQAQAFLQFVLQRRNIYQRRSLPRPICC